MTNRLSSWTMPILRIGMGLFLAAWGVDKLMATAGSQRIFSGMYFIESGPTLVQLAGVAEILLGAALAVGLLRIFTAWVALVANLISTVASWRQILDPWGVLGLTDGGTHLLPRLHRHHGRLGGARPQRPRRYRDARRPARDLARALGEIDPL